MPHAETNSPQPTTDTTNMSTPNGTTQLTNGEKPSSKVLSHLQSYPLIHDSLELYRSHPYGAKSLSLLQHTYARFIAPLHPYLQTPYSYLSPYLSRADELGDNGLSNIDTKFPIVKEDTTKLKEHVQGIANKPVQVLGKGKEYVWGVWEDEYRKTRGEEGVVKSVKAFVSAELKVGIDGVKFVRGYLGRGKEAGEKKVEAVKQ